MKYTREWVEAKGRMGAGLQGNTADWYRCNILGDIPIYCRKDDGSVTPCLINEGFWESWITAWVLNNVGPGTLFVDVGSNTGYYSLIAKRYGAQVMAFEPNPQYSRMLRATIHLDWNQSRGNWLPHDHFNVYEYALSDTVGDSVILTVPHRLQGSATIRENMIDETEHPSDHIRAMTNTLDNTISVVKSEKTIIKIDAEGAEEMIWDGASLVRQLHKPIFILEYTPGAYGRDFLDKIERYGDLAWINHSGIEEPISKSDIIAHSDWIMLVIRPRN